MNNIPQAGNQQHGVTTDKAATADDRETGDPVPMSRLARVTSSLDTQTRVQCPLVVLDQMTPETQRDEVRLSAQYLHNSQVGPP